MLAGLQAPPVAVPSSHLREDLVEGPEQVAAVVDEHQLVVLLDGLPADQVAGQQRVRAEVVAAVRNATGTLGERRELGQLVGWEVAVEQVVDVGEPAQLRGRRRPRRRRRRRRGRSRRTGTPGVPAGRAAEVPRVAADHRRDRLVARPASDEQVVHQGVDVPRGGSRYSDQYHHTSKPRLGLASSFSPAAEVLEGRGPAGADPLVGLGVGDDVEPAAGRRRACCSASRSVLVGRGARRTVSSGPHRREPPLQQLGHDGRALGVPRPDEERGRHHTAPRRAGTSSGGMVIATRCAAPRSALRRSSRGGPGSAPRPARRGCSSR